MTGVIIYVVERGEYEDVQIDSVWSTRAGAEARAAACEREHGSWRAPGHLPRRWSGDLPAVAECVADGARVIEFTVDAPSRVWEGR